jgi:murein DD-endopeptidase MepM/ murein hydrolase activator NlpD
VSDTIRAARFHDVRTFTAGAACGFVAGAFAVTVLLWQAGYARSSSQTDDGRPATQAAAARKWLEALDDAGPGVLENEDGRTAAIGRTTPAAPSPAPAAMGPTVGDAGELSGRQLEMPVEGVDRSKLTSQFHQQRGSTREHEAIDILAPRNTPVHAVEGGRIARLFFSKLGGITIYQFDPTERYCYYYAHLERYADDLREGQPVQKGQVIGYVGTSGNAPPETPHLHFAVFRLTAEKHWWEGTPLDPYDLLR